MVGYAIHKPKISLLHDYGNSLMKMEVKRHVLRQKALACISSPTANATGQ